MPSGEKPGTRDADTFVWLPASVTITLRFYAPPDTQGGTFECLCGWPSPNTAGTCMKCSGRVR